MGNKAARKALRRASKAVVAKTFPSGFCLSQAYRARAVTLGACLGLGFVALLGRYAYLGLLPTNLREKLLTQGSRQFESDVTLAPPRAQITDRNGRTLAVSVLYPSLFVVPRRIPDDIALQRRVARTLGVPASEIQTLAGSRKAFAWLRRQVPPTELARMGDLSEWHDFVGVIDEPKRLYPEKDLAAHLIGFTGLDNNGLEGAERIYDDSLNGTAVKAKVTRDARGRVTLIAPGGAVRPEPRSEPLRLSIDLSIQSFVESALREGAHKARARGGSAVVMNVETGELLAIASWPTYDLNAPPTDAAKRRFRPLMDALELGSVVKPMFVAAALDKGLIRPTDKLHCENGAMRIPGGAIHDDHPHGLSTPSEIIKFSSNICTYKIAQKLGRVVFRDVIQQFGFARLPGTGLPGEWQGRVSAPDTWREMRFANMAFGQGIAISPLQLTKAMSILSGGGSDKPVRILAHGNDEPYESERLGPSLQVISPKTSRLVTAMMSTVVEEEGGTGRRAAIPGLTVAGKTGTAEKYMQATKSYSERIASFTGVVPAEAPKLAITVVLDEPQVRPAYGGTLAGPVFSEIGQKTIHYLNSVGELAIHGAEENNPL
jgi:cell division protein FtsI (penicillin-binding protein 3)